MKHKQFADALDRSLSGMVFDEAMQRRVLRQIHQESARIQPQTAHSLRQVLARGK